MCRNDGSRADLLGLGMSPGDEAGPRMIGHEISTPCVEAWLPTLLAAPLVASKAVSSLSKPRIHLEVWIDGAWKRFSFPDKFAKQVAARQMVFDISARGKIYTIDLIQMTRTNKETGSRRTIRIVDSAGPCSPLGFERFRSAFHKVARAGVVTEESLFEGWLPMDVQSTARCRLRDDLGRLTAKRILQQMDFLQRGEAGLSEWNHFCALEESCIPEAARKDLSEKLVQASQQDGQLLQKLQAIFEAAVLEDLVDCNANSSDRLSGKGLLRTCRHLCNFADNSTENNLAKQVVLMHSEGKGPGDDALLSYYDFLNIMLGRERFKVCLWMYDISNSIAKNWSWLLLGQHFDGIWHTAIVIEWPERTSEFWFGGRLMESRPGTTTFGQPVEKREIGYTYKKRGEVLSHICRNLMDEFRPNSYDALTHNCNHFSKELSSFLCSASIPDEVLQQPDMVMSTFAARALRPALNRWLGRLNVESDQAGDDDEVANEIWEETKPGAVVEFKFEERGSLYPGLVRSKRLDREDCVICILDVYGNFKSRVVTRGSISRVLRPPLVGFVCEVLDSEDLLLSPLKGYAGCCFSF